VAGSLAGNRLPYAPEHLATTSIGFTHEKGFDLRLEAVYTAEQFSDFANTPVAAANGNGQVGIIKPALVFNAAATAPIWRSGVSLFVAAKNLLDRDYIVDRTRGIRVGMPLLLQAGVEIEF
jgi:Fe(3+) dicitrate transport protein